MMEGNQRKCDDYKLMSFADRLTEAQRRSNGIAVLGVDPQLELPTRREFPPDIRFRVSAAR